jgi:DNA-binding response OmpR family regulator
VALTAHVLEGDRVRCRIAGMDGYVSKPLRVIDLFQAISEVLPRTESTRSAGVPRELEACLDAVDGDRAALEKIVTLFLEQYPVLLTQIRDAANVGDCTVAARRLTG